MVDLLTPTRRRHIRDDNSPKGTNVNSNASDGSVFEVGNGFSGFLKSSFGFRFRFIQNIAINSLVFRF